MGVILLSNLGMSILNDYLGMEMHGAMAEDLFAGAIVTDAVPGSLCLLSPRPSPMQDRKAQTAAAV
jgi:hypothetical protein